MNTLNTLFRLALLPLVTSATALAAPFNVTLSAHDPALVCGSTATPALTFGTPPAGTKALAVIFWDQQPGKLTVRWTVYDLPLKTRQLTPIMASNLNPEGGKAGINEASKPGFTAPCASGRHDLYVDFYALNVASLGLPAGAPLQRVHAAIKAHKILEAKAHLALTIK